MKYDFHNFKSHSRIYKEGVEFLFHTFMLKSKCKREIHIILHLPAKKLFKKTRNNSKINQAPLIDSIN